MIINFTNDHQFQSLLTIPGSSSPILLTFQTKLLGYWMTCDMKPDVHVKYLLGIAYSRLWAISRLKSAGSSDDDILHFFNIKIRSVLEYSAPVYTPMLTVQNINNIERVQKIEIKVILNEKYEAYHEACQLLHTQSLKARRLSVSPFL